jgi:hypothetical protein
LTTLYGLTTLLFNMKASGVQHGLFNERARHWLMRRYDNTKH